MGQLYLKSRGHIPVSIIPSIELHQNRTMKLPLILLISVVLVHNVLPLPMDNAMANGLERACCLAMNADCLSCAAGMEVEEYCTQNPSTYGCRVIEEGQACGCDMTMSCLGECKPGLECTFDDVSAGHGICDKTKK